MMHKVSQGEAATQPSTHISSTLPQTWHSKHSTKYVLYRGSRAVVISQSLPHFLGGQLSGEDIQQEK